LFNNNKFPYRIDAKIRQYHFVLMGFQELDQATEHHFDATQIDPSTVSMEGMEIKMVGKSEKLLAHIEDVNGDGLLDMVVQIQDQDGVFTSGSSTAIVTGNLYDGTPFTGSDSICVVP
jgi:hypothetical protein